jgi:hypothetical protein
MQYKKRTIAVHDVDPRQFDNIEASASTSQPVGTYMDLQYPGFVVVNQTAILVGDNINGVPAHSPPNTIAFDFRSETDGNLPSIIPASPTIFFYLRNFYFGCAIP